MSEILRGLTKRELQIAKMAVALFRNMGVNGKGATGMLANPDTGEIEFAIQICRDAEFCANLAKGMARKVKTGEIDKDKVHITTLGDLLEGK